MLPNLILVYSDLNTFVAILNGKQPPSLFFESSHVGFIPAFIINNIQFFTIFSGIVCVDQIYIKLRYFHNFLDQSVSCGK